MSNEEFENYVALIGKLLQLHPEQRDQIGGELQDHLQMRVADLTDDGLTKQAAISQALEEFGDAAVMAKNFQTVINMKRRRWMMRFATLATAGLFVVATLLMALWPDNARFGAPEYSTAQQATDEAVQKTGFYLSDATRRDQQTAEALEKSISVDYDETPFLDVMEHLTSETGLNFFLHGCASDDSLTADELITLRLKNVTTAKMLEILLETKNATYTIDEGIVVIISQDYAEDTKYLRMRMFDCRDIVNLLPETLPSQYASSSASGATKSNAKGGGLFCVQQPSMEELANQNPLASNQDDISSDSKPETKATEEAPTNSPPPTPVASRGMTLLNIVQSSIAPDSWESNGQGLATISEVNGILIICQKESEFRNIDRLLADLRAYILSEEAGVEISSRLLASPAAQSTKPKIAESTTSDVDPFGSGSDDDDNPFSK
ncbi:MAG: permease prefix domain 1-containing protein [Mariniblastus sp.]